MKRGGESSLKSRIWDLKKQEALSLGTWHVIEEEVGSSNDSGEGGRRLSEGEGKAGGPVHQGADANVQPVLDQDVDGVLGPGKSRWLQTLPKTGFQHDCLGYRVVVFLGGSGGGGGGRFPSIFVKLNISIVRR